MDTVITLNALIKKYYFCASIIKRSFGHPHKTGVMIYERRWEKSGLGNQTPGSVARIDRGILWCVLIEAYYFQQWNNVGWRCTIIQIIISNPSCLWENRWKFVEFFLLKTIFKDNIFVLKLAFSNYLALNNFSEISGEAVGYLPKYLTNIIST